MAGDKVGAMYGLESGAVAHFDSARNAGGRPSPFGLTIFGSRGVIQGLDAGCLPEMLESRDMGSA